VDWQVWTMFAVTEGALTLAPGPAVLYVVSQGLRRGSGDAHSSALGILMANGLYFAASGTGLGALLAASGRIFSVVKWAGAGYLLCLGVATFFRRTALPAGDDASEPLPRGGRTCFVRGLLLQLANPKALLFFVAILPQFLDRSRPVLPQVLIFGATSIVMEFVVLAAYGVAAGRAARVATTPRFATATSRVSGTLLVGAALGLARLER